MSELTEMGWNDVIGNLRRAFKCTAEQKLAWCRQMAAGEINLPRFEPDYVEGTREAAQAVIDGQKAEDLAFRGPADVVADMEAKCTPPKKRKRKSKSAS